MTDEAQGLHERLAALEDRVNEQQVAIESTVELIKTVISELERAPMALGPGDAYPLNYEADQILKKLG